MSGNITTGTYVFSLDLLFKDVFSITTVKSLLRYQLSYVTQLRGWGGNTVVGSIEECWLLVLTVQNVIHCSSVPTSAHLKENGLHF